MLGRDVVSAAEREGHEVTALDRAALDIRDADAVREAVRAARPSVVINCAAYTDVDGAESEPEAAFDVNASGAGHLAAAAAEIEAAVLYVSTDYIFDGSKQSPYVESDEPNPLSVYGASKLAGERATADANPQSFIVRTSWLFGRGGPNFVETMLRLAAERGRVSVVNDQFGCPTYTGDLATALVRLGGGEQHGTHHISGAGACSWYEFAERIFDLAGIECELTPCPSSSFPRPAPRPANSVLESGRGDSAGLRAWPEALSELLSLRAA